ncbi:MAG: choice-of-anchor B family protein [Bacteroidota bacterium]|nr:choice-of-anchor B family protein [Bacteroidota bacterium]
MKEKLLAVLFLFPFFAFAQSGWNMNLLGSFSYPSTNCSDIWGWEDSTGNEYALVGLKDGFSCVNVSNPATAYEEFFVSDISSTWRDIKSWGNYAYITTEANAGLLIVDLSDMSGNTYWHVTQFNNPTTGVSINFTSAHNIYIDENGIAYIFGARNNGSPVVNRGAIFLDVNANPTNPVYLGDWDNYYIHDGMARGDTMYVGCIYEGKMYVVDVSDKSNPQTIGSITTPNAFTHNAWVSDDGNFVFTTDEQSDAYLAAYNISDVTNIQEVDRIQSNPGSNSIPHNTHVDGNFLITSYYRDGTTVHDITHPNHMIQVAYYDSYAGSGNGFNGCWGTYPFLSSGNIISSDRDSENGKGILNIYGRTFQQACYLSGNVIDGTNGNNIGSTDITILSTTTTVQTNIIGNYQTALVDSGSYLVVFSKSGYISDTLQVTLTNGVMTILDAILYPPCFMNISISTTDVSCNGGSDGSANVQVIGGQPPYIVDWAGTNPNALFAGTYPITISNNNCTTYDTIIISQPNAINLSLMVTNVLCHSDCDGSVFTNISGGVQPYVLSWFNNGNLISNGQSINNLCSGDYNLSLIDNNNCLTNTLVSIIDPPVLSTTVSADTILCNGGTSIATVYTYGGVAPYYYNWSNNATTQSTSLATGLFFVDVTDSNGCNIIDSILVIEHDSMVLNFASTDISCNGNTDGTIILNVISGGQIPFQYSVDNGATFQNNNHFASLSAGNYNVVIMDGNNCLANVFVNLIEPQPLSAVSSITDVSCYGYCDGSISLSISGGTPIYSQDWNGANPNSLCAGTFNCSITDANGCLLILSNSVIEPTSLNAQILQNANDLDALVSGGTPSYTYLWSTGEISASITPNTNGIFWLIVTDNNYCNSDTVSIIFDNIPLTILENTLSKKLIKITDILGRTTFPDKQKQTLFYLFDDGTVEQKNIID